MLNARRRVAEAEEALRNCEPEQFLDAQGRYDGFFQAFEALEDEYYEALAAKAEVYERENAAPVPVRTAEVIIKELGY